MSSIEIPFLSRLKAADLFWAGRKSSSLPFVFQHNPLLDYFWSPHTLTHTVAAAGVSFFFSLFSRDFFVSLFFVALSALSKQPSSQPSKRPSEQPSNKPTTHPLIHPSTGGALAQERDVGAKRIRLEED